MSEGRQLLDEAQRHIDLAQGTFLQKLRTKAWYSGRKSIRNVFRWGPALVGNAVPIPIVSDMVSEAVGMAVDKVCATSREGKLAKYTAAAQLDGNNLENLRKLAKFEGKTLKDLGDRIDRNMVKLKDSTQAAKEATDKVQGAPDLNVELMVDAARKLTNKARYVKKMLLIVETNRNTLDRIVAYLDKMNESCTAEQDAFIAAVDAAHRASVAQPAAPGVAPPIPPRPGMPPPVPPRPGMPPPVPPRPGMAQQVPPRAGVAPPLPPRPGMGPPVVPPRPGMAVPGVPGRKPPGTP